MTATVTEQTVARAAARGLGWSLLGNLGVRLLNVASSVVMARLIAPQEFGVFAVALTVWTIVGTIAEFGLGSDLVRTPDVDRLIPTVSTLSVGFCVALAAVMAATAAPLSAGFGTTDSEGTIRLLAVSTALSGFAVVPNALLQREFRQRAITVAMVASTTLGMVVMITAARAGGGAAALAWGQIVGQVALVGLLSVAVRRRPLFGWNPAVARGAVAFGLPLASANLVSWLLLTVDNVIVARRLGPVELGFYALAFNISSWPMSAVGVAIRSVALPAFSRLGAPRQACGVLAGLLAPVSCLAALLSLGLATLAGPLVALLYGADWSAAAAPLVGLAIFGGLRVLLDLTATFLIALGRTRDVLVVQLIWLVAMVPAMLVGVGRFGLSGAGWAHVVVAAGVVGPAYLVCLRRLGGRPIALVRAVAVPVAAAIPAIAVCTWIGGLSGPPVLLIGIGAVLGVVLYAAPTVPLWWRTVAQVRSPAVEAAA